MRADAKIAARHEAAPAATSRDAKRTARIAALHEAAAQRILVLDGSWGAKIQELSLTEEDFRGERFAAHPTSLRGDTDILCLTAPDVVSTLAGEYLAAGADIITTNTFTATSIAQADYDMQEHVVEINHAGARLSREAADRFEAADPSRPRWVAGSIGPTNRTLSISPSVEDPGARAVDFEMKKTGAEHVLLGARRDQARMGHIGVGQGAQHARLPAHGFAAVHALYLQARLGAHPGVAA